MSLHEHLDVFECNMNLQPDLRESLTFVTSLRKLHNMQLEKVRHCYHVDLIIHGRSNC
jgi:hypothetical protein